MSHAHAPQSWLAGRWSGLAIVLMLWLAFGPGHVEAAADKFALKSNIALVVDRDTGEMLVSKNVNKKVPIASLTKLMTALVVTEKGLPMDEVLEISRDDRDGHSRLPVGARLTRGELMLLALMSSENRASMTLSREYPGGRKAFIARMNAKAKALGMKSTRFTDPSGLSEHNVSTANDLLKLIHAADQVDLIRRYSTQPDAKLRVRGSTMQFVNTNRLVRNSRDWDIELQKTGFTNAAGRCLVMRATTTKRRLSMVFLDSVGTLTRFADATRVRKQLELQARGRSGKATKVAGSAGS